MRTLKALVVAGLLAVMLGAMAELINPCSTLTPDNWFLWWFYGCEKDGSGGGGSGAGME